MTQTEFQNELTIIKEMIDKTKRETANYGHLFVIPGFLLIVMIVIIHLLNQSGMEHMVTTTLIISILIIALVSAFIGFLVSKKKSVTTYTSKIFTHIWVVSGAACLLIAIVFPLFDLYSMSIAPLVCWPILGIALYLTGIIYECNLISVFSLAWFAGAMLTALLPDGYSFYITLLTIILGYITPGLILNKKYKSEVN